MLDMSRKRERAILVCSVIMMASPVVIPLAWREAAAAEAPDREVGLEEIVVTATRRETKLSDTPIALSVVTAEQINSQRVVNFADLEQAVPNLVFTQVTRQETVFSIRGTGVDNDTPGSDAGVSVFIDGVPRTGVHDTTPDFFDLQSVEVLRGPQGTLFGRNTTGGAVIMHTIAASFEPSFKTQLTYGNHNLVEVDALATGPLVSDSLAGKFSILLHRRDGYIDNVVQNRENGREKAGSMRGQLLWLPTDGLKVTWAGEYSRDTSESRVGSLESTFVPPLFPTLQFGPDFSNAALTPRASSTIGGLSATAQWSIGAYTDAKYREYNALQDDGSTVSYAGKTIPQTPKQQVHFASEIRVPWTQTGGDVMFGADYTYRSKIQFVDANDTPQVILDKTRINGFVNLHAGWRSANDAVSVNVFARDITDKRALVSFPDFTPYYATLPEFIDPRNHIYLSRYTPARTFGVTFTLRY